MSGLNETSNWCMRSLLSKDLTGKIYEGIDTYDHLGKNMFLNIRWTKKYTFSYYIALNINQ